MRVRLPPVLALMGRVDTDPFAHLWRAQAHLSRRCQGYDTVERLLPSVDGKVESAVMDRQHPAPAQVKMCLQTLLWLHVHVGPGHVVGTGLDQCQVERPEALADFAKALEVTGITAEEHTRLVVYQHPGGPQGAVAVEQAAP